MNEYDILPVRFGGDVGGADERVMLSQAGGSNTIRTVEEVLPDGTLVILQTRAGNPEFVVIPPEISVDILRGWVVRLPDQTTGVLFNPYNMTVEQTPYALVPHQYYVAKFDTSAAPLDWYDVLTNKESAGYINAVASSTHGLPKGAPYLPAETPAYATNGLWVISANKAKHANNTEVLLQPLTPYNDQKALFGGPWVQDSADKACMTQAWFSGGSWDDSAGAFGYSCSTYVLGDTSAAAEVRYTPAIGIPVPSFSYAGSSGNYVSYSGLPAIIGHINTRMAEDVGAEGHYHREFVGLVADADARLRTYTSYSQSQWSSSYSDTLQFTPTETLSVSISNVFALRANSRSSHAEYHHVQTAFEYVGGSQMRVHGGRPPPGIQAAIEDIGTSIGNVTYVDHGWFNLQPNPNTATTSTVSKDQTLSYSVTMGAQTLFSLSASYTYENGTFPVLVPGAPPSQTVIDNFMSWQGGHVTSVDTDELTESENNNPITFAYYWATLGQIVSVGHSILSPQIRSSTYVANMTADDFIVMPNRTAEAMTMPCSWTTKDYFLYDVQEQIYGWVEASCSTASGAQTLTVVAKFDFRGTPYTKSLESYSFPSDLPLPLIRADAVVSNSECMPTPIMNALFMPPVRQLGLFPGIAYTTLAEEAVGIAEAILVNMRLSLSIYGNMGGVQPAALEGNRLSFTPFFLIEALYGFVFSHWAGHHPTERYPVTSPTIYKAVTKTLFSTDYVIQLSGGTADNWVSDIAGIDAAYASRSNEVEIFRT